MTGAQIKKILKNAGYELTDKRFPKFRTIIMQTNQSIDPIRDEITFDFSNELIKIKQYDYKIIDGHTKVRPYSDNEYDILIDMDEVVGIEMVSSQVGLS